MQIHCPNCHTPVSAAQINIQDKLAVCPHCNAVFSFEKDLRRKAKERKVKQPKYLSVTETDDSLDIYFRWLRMWRPTDYLIIVVFGLTAIFPAIASVAAFSSGPSFIMGMVGGGLAALALFLLYWFFMALIDRLRITVDDTTLSAKYEPLPKAGMPRIAINEIERVYIYQPKTDVPKPRQRSNYCFVQVACRDGREITLATLRYDLALFVAQTIDSYLHDEPEIELTETDSDADLSLLAEREQPLHMEK